MYLEKVASLIWISQQILDKAHELWLSLSLFCIICLQKMIVEKDVSHWSSVPNLFSNNFNFSSKCTWDVALIYFCQ